METSLSQLIPAILAGFAGLVGSACAWFVFARQLVTRKEVRDMIRDSVETMAAAQARQEQSTNAMRSELVALRGEVSKRGVLLEVTRARDRDTSAGRDETKGS
jgi:hypothetical protein